MEGTKSEKIVFDPREDDVCLGRGNAVNFRKGNANFRQLARENAAAYCKAPSNDKTTKDDIALNILKEIKRRGGRFLRSISVTGEDGSVVAAWEIVDDDTAIAKAKQALRDSVAAIRKETAEQYGNSAPSGTWTDDPIDRRRRSFQAMGNQGERVYYNEDPHHQQLGGGGSFNTMALGRGSTMSRDMINTSMLMPHGLNFLDPTESRHGQATVPTIPRSSNFEETMLRDLGPRLQPETMARWSATFTGTVDLSTPLDPRDSALLECLQRIHQEAILRRRRLLSQLSDETLRHFLASEGYSNLGGMGRSTAAIEQERLGSNTIPFTGLQQRDQVIPSEARLKQESSARQSAPNADDKGTGKHRMPSPKEPASRKKEKIKEESGTTRERDTDPNSMPPPKKRHKSYKRDDESN